MQMIAPKEKRKKKGRMAELGGKRSAGRVFFSVIGTLRMKGRKRARGTPLEKGKGTVRLCTNSLPIFA